MSSRAKSEVASALKARVDLSLLARAESESVLPPTFSNRAHNKSNIGTLRAHDKSAIGRPRAHNKSNTDDPVVPNLTGAARERVSRLASLLASTHSD